MASNSEKKEKSQTEFIVIVVFVGIMMAIFINYFIKNETQFTHAAFTTIAQSFNTKVNAVRAQWFMDKQPNVVYLASFNKEKKQAVTVNKSGWIDAHQAQSTCEIIWLLVLETPMNSMRFSVSAIEVFTSSDTQQSAQVDAKNSQCRYVLLDGSYFQYNRANGKVSKVITLN
ncbi:MAG: hypothetical protein JKY81_00660 [Colwellia sp.]|nr:hypothetical protein [Colwellia sp.]